MHSSSSIILLAALLCQGVSSIPADIDRRAPSSDAAVRTVYEFPVGTFVENLAARANGEILVSALNDPHLFLFDPTRSGPPAALHTFPVLGLTGIAEYAPDVFAVNAGNFSLETGDPGQGSWSVWSVDMRGVYLKPDGTVSQEPVVSKIADVPDAKLLNGMTALSMRDHTILVGDVSGGNIRRVDADRGEYEAVINNTFTGVAPLPPFPDAGVNGVHVRGDTLYFVNSGKDFLDKVKINRDGTPAGDFELVNGAIPTPGNYDDFAVDQKDEIIYFVSGFGKAIYKVSVDGGPVTLVAGGPNSTAVPGPTSAAFGRGLTDKDVLYVTTSGSSLGPINPGNLTIGGELLAITVAAKEYC